MYIYIYIYASGLCRELEDAKTVDVLYPQPAVSGKQDMMLSPYEL